MEYKTLYAQFRHDQLRKDHIKLINKTNDFFQKERYKIQLEVYDDFMGYNKLKEMRGGTL